MRKGYDNDCRTAMTWAPEGRRKTAEKEREKLDGGARAQGVQWRADDSAGWRQSVEASCATWREVVR